MSGVVSLNSPWCKQGLPLAQRPVVEAEVPDGTYLVVQCGSSGPGKPWKFSLYRGEWPDHELVWGRMDVWNMALKDAALFALRHHAKADVA